MGTERTYSLTRGLIVIVAIYVAANIFSAVATLLNHGAFPGGDFDGFTTSAPSLLVNLCLVVLFYVLSVALYFAFKSKFLAAPRPSSDLALMGWIVLGVQAVLFWELTVRGVTLSQLKDEPSFATYFQTLFVPDYLFLVYYALGRESKLFAPNLALYLISTLARGVSGGFAFFLLFELIYSFKTGRWRIFKIFAFSAAALAPFLYEARELVRSASPEYLLTTPKVELLGNLLTNAYSHFQIGRAALDLSSVVLMRLQHLSSPVMIYDHLNAFWMGDARGRFLPFLLEGAVQTSFFGAGVRNTPPLSQFITSELLPTPFGAWFINPSLVGWLWVDPFAFVVLIGYCVFLYAVNVFMLRRLGGNDYAIACSFVFFTVFVMNGWFGPYISILQASAVLLLMIGFVRYAKRLTL